MMSTTEYTETLWGTDYQFTVSPRADDSFILTSSITAPAEYQFDMSKPNRDPLVNKGVFLEKDGYNLFKTNGVNYFRYANHSYMAAPVAQSGRTYAGTVLFDITNGLGNAVKLSEQMPIAGLGAIAATYMAAYGTVDNHNIILSLLAENQGLATFKTTGLLGVASVKQQSEIRVYPNPIENTLHIDCDFEIKTIKLIDLSGRILMDITSDQRVIDMTGINSGNYIINVNGFPIKVIKK